MIIIIIRYIRNDCKFNWLRIVRFVGGDTNKGEDICLFQGRDERLQNPPRGYVRDTGVTVDGINVLPGGHSFTDLQPQVLCLATRVKCSARVTDRDGTVTTVAWDDAVVDDPDEEYIQGVIFELHSQGFNAPKYVSSIKTGKRKDLSL